MHYVHYADYFWSIMHYYTSVATGLVWVGILGISTCYKGWLPSYLLGLSRISCLSACHCQHPRLPTRPNLPSPESFLPPFTWLAAGTMLMKYPDTISTSTVYMHVIRPLHPTQLQVASIAIGRVVPELKFELTWMSGSHLFSSSWQFDLHCAYPQVPSMRF
jgi:hypothetical protein